MNVVNYEAFSKYNKIKKKTQIAKKLNKIT